MALCGFPSSLEDLPLSDVSVRRVAVRGGQNLGVPSQHIEGHLGSGGRCALGAREPGSVTSPGVCAVAGACLHVSWSFQPH